MSPDSFGPVDPGPSTGPAAPGAAPSAAFAHTVSSASPPVIAPPKKSDRTFRILLTVGLLIAVGGVTFAIGRVTAPAAAATTRGGFGAGGFANGGAGGAGAGAGFGRGGFGGGIFVTGTVETISPTTMTLKEANGTIVTVDLAGTTTYHSQAAATAAAVTTGKQVQVEVQIVGAFGGQGAPGASPVPDAASPAASGAPTPRTITARDVTLVTP